MRSLARLSMSSWEGLEMRLVSCVDRAGSLRLQRVCCQHHPNWIEAAYLELLGERRRREQRVGMSGIVGDPLWRASSLHTTR